MDNFTAKKYVEHVLYILNKAGGLDYYRLFKIMYFAQRAYLKEYGAPRAECKIVSSNTARLEDQGEYYGY